MGGTGVSSSPYESKPQDAWGKITKKLVEAHPLQLSDIRDLSCASWGELWQTTIGAGDSAFLLAEINPPAQVVGYLFEKLFLRNLMSRFPGEWRGPTGRTEKDLVFVPDINFSIELKTSGQLGRRVFGNRSYGQASTEREAKGKSGYYVTVNFYEKFLNLVRFGWIDHSDWRAQASQTGQMAGLGDEVYRHKLLIINGEYQLQAPPSILRGVGPGMVIKLREEGIATLADLLAYTGDKARIVAARLAALEFLGE